MLFYYLSEKIKFISHVFIVLFFVVIWHHFVYFYYIYTSGRTKITIFKLRARHNIQNILRTKHIQYYFMHYSARYPTWVSMRYHHKSSSSQKSIHQEPQTNRVTPLTLCCSCKWMQPSFILHVSILYSFSTVPSSFAFLPISVFSPRD